MIFEGSVGRMDRQMTEEEKMLLPEQLDAEEESPYLRRQRAVAVRRHRDLLRLRWAPFLAAAVALIGIASYSLRNFALSSARFELHSADDVQVTGNQFVSREEVANALGLPLHAGSGPGSNVFRLSLQAKRKQAKSLAWVRDAALMRILPNRLVVHVFERTPVAFTNAGGHVSLVDGDGVLLDRPENASFDFPVITGLDAVANLDERRARVALYQDFIRQLGEEISHSGWIISEASLADADDVKALLVQGRETLQVHFGHENFLEHFHTFLALLPELRRSNAPLDSVDLRYRNQVVVNPQAPSPVQPPGDVDSSRTLKE
jgi:cell division protein FtsQ